MVVIGGNCMINMLKILKNIDEYIDFINRINSTDNYSDPMLSNEVQIKNIFE